MGNHKIKAIIFDVDGVLFQSLDNQGRYVWSQHIKKDLGLASIHFALIFSPKWNDVVCGKIDIYDHLSLIFQNDLFENLEITPQKYIDYWLNHDQRIHENVLELAGACRVPCYLGTNQEVVRKKHIMNGIGTHFQGCFASCDIGFMKPNHPFFQHIETTLSLMPHELLLIDDMKLYVDSAQKCGWHAYHYQNDTQALIHFLKSHDLIDYPFITK